jgi:hypothetical protein
MITASERKGLENRVRKIFATRNEVLRKRREQVFVQ